MIELYVVRGTGSSADTIWISDNYDVTWLHKKTRVTVANYWRPHYVGATSTLCYRDFAEQTNIELEPGEYTKIRIEEVLP